MKYCLGVFDRVNTIDGGRNTAEWAGEVLGGVVGRGEN